MTPARHVDDAERRARLAGTVSRMSDVVAAARSVVALHGTDPASVHLSALARVPTLTAPVLDTVLHDTRGLVKHLAMRRTLFVFPREVLPVAQAVCGPRVEHGETRALLKDTGHPVSWLEETCAATVALLADGVPRSLDELRDGVPELRGSTPGWQGRPQAVGPRVLTVLTARGLLVRAANEGHWRTSRHRWTTMAAWLGGPLPVLDPPEAEATLVGWWLRAFGPGTEADLRWWLGSTLTVVRRALARLDAVTVSLDGGAIGWLLPEDVEPVADPGPWARLLPALDPTLMGWHERRWYLGDLGRDPRVFDAVGNGGPTAWWRGRVVGTWHQDEHGATVVVPLERLPAAATRALAVEAERVTAYCDGVRVVRPWPLGRARD